MEGISVTLFILAYLSAVVDGVLAEKGNLPSPVGRTGFRLFRTQHRWIVLGAVCGVLGCVASLCD
jgi:hypothetical protein